MMKFSKLFNKLFLDKKNQTHQNNYYHSYLQNHEPYWMPREYQKFAEEAYSKNVIANRCINLIAQSAARIGWVLHKIYQQQRIEIKNHSILKLLEKPNPLCGGTEFFENIYAYRLISGNAFITAVGPDHLPPKELHLLRPDRVKIIEGKNSLPLAYEYQVDDNNKLFPVNNITGKSKVLHIRNFHPMNDYYGLSPVECAAYSIDQHNQAAIWNQALLQNGARPSGAVIVKTRGDNINSNLSQEQFDRLKVQINDCYTGAINSGRPLLLEGGLEWQEMSMSPKDMDFIEAKNSAAREIALAFGVPPQLLGIPGDNKYSNMQEARLALWEETVLPVLDHMCDALNGWLIPMFGADLKISYNKDEITALSHKRENMWLRLENASFMTINEKRAAVGLASREDGDKLFIS